MQYWNPEEIKNTAESIVFFKTERKKNFKYVWLVHFDLWSIFAKTKIKLMRQFYNILKLSQVSFLLSCVGARHCNSHTQPEWQVFFFINIFMSKTKTVSIYHLQSNKTKTKSINIPKDQWEKIRSPTSSNNEFVELCLSIFLNKSETIKNQEV